MGRDSPGSRVSSPPRGRPALRQIKRVRWKPYGPEAMLITFAESVGEAAFQRGRALTAVLEQSPPPGLVEFVPSFTTLLLEFDPRVVPDLAAVAKNSRRETGIATTEMGFMF